MDGTGRFELAAVRPYLRGNLVYLMNLIRERKGIDRANLIEILSPLKAYPCHGDREKVLRAWPSRIRYLLDDFLPPCTLPDHVIPVYTDTRDGCMVPMTCNPADQWDASDACARFSVARDGDSAHGLIDIISAIEAAWKRAQRGHLPLRWRRAYSIGIAIPVHVGDIEGSSMHLPIALMILREAAASFKTGMPFGEGPVFCTGPISKTGAFETDSGHRVRHTAEKLDGFIREYGPGRPAILTRAQHDELSSRLLGQIKYVVADRLDDLFREGPLQEGLAMLAGRPHATEIDHLTRLITRLERGLRFSSALEIGDYLLPHANTPPYQMRVCCAVGHLLLHQGKIRAAEQFLDHAESVIVSGTPVGTDVRAHYAAVKGIHLLDAGDPKGALDVLDIHDLNDCTHITRIEVLGTRAQALRGLGRYEAAAATALEAARLAKDGRASEAGRDLNYGVHALIRQAEALGDHQAEERGILLRRAELLLEESRSDWAPVEPVRRAAHLLFCQHYQEELARVRRLESEPALSAGGVRKDWRHPWLFAQLACSRNPANPMERRLKYADSLVADSAKMIAGDETREVFTLFNRVYAIWRAALRGEDIREPLLCLQDWCDNMDRAGFPGWKSRLTEFFADPPDNPQTALRWADQLCSAIYFH